MYALHICDNFFQLTKGMFSADCLQFYSARLHFFKMLTIPAIILQQQTLSNQLQKVSFQSNFQQEAFSTTWLNEIQQKIQCFLQNQDSFQTLSS